MDTVLIKRFNSEDFYSFLWRGKVCWMGLDIARHAGYKDETKAIRGFIESRKLRKDRDYTIIRDNELKEFKRLFTEATNGRIKCVSEIVLLYEEGCYRFLTEVRKPLAPVLKKWIRLEVIPVLEIKGAYTLAEPYYNKYYREDIELIIGMSFNLKGI